MKMTMVLLTLAVLVIGYPCGSIAQGQVSADAFLAPAAGGSQEVEGEVVERVDDVTGEVVVVAETAQAALNAAIARHKEGLVRFGSGYGFVVSGEAAYQELPNRDATVVSRRLAYVKAYENAKKQLNVTLRGISNQSWTRLYDEANIETSESETRSDIRTDMDTEVAQFTAGLLRGFVVYEVSENASTHTVRVSLATTPKTLAAARRTGGAALSAETLRDGLEQVLVEIRSGVVSPVGGRVIDVRGTDEVAIVGFGSAVVRHSDNPAVEVRLRTVATRSAIMYATDAPCGLITGEEQSWTGTLTESTKERYKDFADTGTDDSEEELDDLRSSFVNRIKLVEEYQTATEGQLPAGTIKDSWISDDGDWALCVAVYSPSMEAQASSFRDVMEREAAPSGTVDPDATGPGVQEGTIHDDEDL